MHRRRLAPARLHPPCFPERRVAVVPTRPLVATLVAALAITASVACAAAYRTATATAAPLVFDVHRFGAAGDGRHNDSGPLQRAIDRAAAHPGSIVYLPRGTYSCPAGIRLRSRVNLRGDGSSSSWLQGHLDFASRSTISKLKIGTAGVDAVSNLSGASHTTFSRCRFRGGGAGSGGAVVLLGSSSGSSHSLSYVTFSHCQIERNLGVEDWSVNGGSGHGYNDISVYENPNAGGSQISHLAFLACHVGVSNGAGGHDTGSPRADIEVWTGTGKIVKGWSHLTIRGCVFEASDRFCIDLADWPAANGMHLAGPALIEGNTIKGGGYGSGDHPWSYSICLEAPRNVRIAHNTIYGAADSTICGSYGPASHTVIVYDHIDLTVANGVQPTGDEAVVLKGQDNVFEHNVVKGGDGCGALLYLKKTTGDQVSANQFYDARSSDIPAMVKLQDASHNVIAHNVFSTAAGSVPRMLILGSSSQNTLLPNTFRHS
jgi:hypothetical protein